MILYQHSETLSKIAIFKYIESKGVILYLFRKLQPVFYDVDHFIVYENSVAKDISFLVSGKCELYRSKIKNLARDNRRGRGRTQSKGLKTIPLALCDKVATIEPGDMFGHFSLMTKKPFTASVRTFLPSSVYNLPESEITRLLNEFPQVAIILQDAIGCAIFNRRQKGKDDYRKQRASFIAEIRKLFLEKRAQKLGESNLAKKKARKKRISTFLSRGISLGSSNTSLLENENNVANGPRIRRTVTPLHIGIPKTSGKYVISSKVAPAVIDEKDGNQKNIKNLPPSCSFKNQSASEDKDCEHVATTVKPFSEVESETNSVGDESPITAQRKKPVKYVTPARRRWKMIAAVIRDPAMMAVIAQSMPEKICFQEKEKTEHPLLDKLKNIGHIGVKIKAEEGQGSNELSLVHDVKKSSSLSEVVRDGLKKVKVDRINLVGPDNEDYDSEEDVKATKEYILKERALTKNAIECPDFSNSLIFDRRRKPRRRSSFPSYDMQDWKERKKYVYHL